MEKKNTNDKISIVIPVYNVASFLDRCLLSVMRQTYKALEILLVDDGSTDGSGTLCDLYASLDNRITVLHQQNGGLSSARNAGMAIAQGRYLCFLDSDDYVSPRYIEALLQALEENNADVSICSSLRVVGLGDDTDPYDVKPYQKFTMRQEVMTSLQVQTYWAEKNQAAWVVVWNKLYKRELFDGIEFPVGRFHEDEFIMHRIYSRCTRIAGIEEVLHYYVVRNGSIMNQDADPRHLDGAEACLLRALDYVKVEAYTTPATLTFQRALSEIRRYYTLPGIQISHEHRQRNELLQRLGTIFLQQLPPHIGKTAEHCQQDFSATLEMLSHIS